MHRFFVEADNLAGQHVLFDEKEVRHMQKVLRLKPGDRVIGFDGKGHEFEITLVKEIDGTLRGKIEAVSSRETEPNISLHLVQGLAKAEKMDTIIQKAVEIGVYSIYPLVTQNTVVKIKEDKQENKLKRWQTIAREACKQCRRNYIPEVKPVQDINDFLKNRDKGGVAIMLYENEYAISLGQAVKSHLDIIKQKGVYLLIGPEGGFSSQEAEAARRQGVITAGLGPRILRTETAGLVAASIVLYICGAFEL